MRKAEDNYTTPVTVKQAINALESAYGTGNVKRVRHYLLCFHNGRQITRRAVIGGKAYL